MKHHRVGYADWSGTLKEGFGVMSTHSAALAAYPYDFRSRMEGLRGTNPEELLAAAHAGCFTMSLVAALDRKGFQASAVDTKASVVLEQVADGLAIRQVHLLLEATISGITETDFLMLAEYARVQYPVSKLVNAKIVLNAKLKR
jgi:osmotically inducible protein OsmC